LAFSGLSHALACACGGGGLMGEVVEGYVVHWCPSCGRLWVWESRRLPDEMVVFDVVERCDDGGFCWHDRDEVVLRFSPGEVGVWREDAGWPASTGSRGWRRMAVSGVPSATSGWRVATSGVPGVRGEALSPVGTGGVGGGRLLGEVEFLGGGGCLGGGWGRIVS